MKKCLTTRSKLQLVMTLIIIATVWLVQNSGVVAAPPGQGGDLAVISSPASNAIVSGTVDITGSADHPSFQFYVVDISPEPNTNDQWNTIGATHDAPVVNGLLESWDTTLVPDGSYTIRLRVVRLDGNYTEFFAQQVVVTNTQPIPTDTPPPLQDETPRSPTVTPTDLPPTPTIVIDQPVVDTPTPRPVPTSPPLEDPDENSSFIPTVTGFSVSPLRAACLYGGAVMLSVFVLFGLLAALRTFFQGFMDLIKGRRS